MKTIAIITARAGSKGLPGKNIRMLHSKPLVAWTVLQALNAKVFDTVVLSTDDQEIAEIARTYGAEVPFIRPGYLAEDSSSSVDVVLHALDFYAARNQNYDVIALLEPTSPLRKKTDLRNATHRFIDQYNLYDGVISLGRISLENPFIAKIVKDGTVQPLIESTQSITNRQDYPDVYFPYGVLYMIKTKVLMETKSFYAGKMMPYFIERWQNYEIDDIFDFICVESIFEHKLNEIEE